MLLFLNFCFALSDAKLNKTLSSPNIHSIASLIHCPKIFSLSRLEQMQQHLFSFSLPLILFLMCMSVLVPRDTRRKQSPSPGSIHVSHHPVFPMHAPINNTRPLQHARSSEIQIIYHCCNIYQLSTCMVSIYTHLLWIHACMGGIKVMYYYVWFLCQYTI